jgi:TonB family protein
MLDLTPASAPAWFSVDEVAMAAGVEVADVWRAIGLGQAALHAGNQMSAADAVHVVRVLRGDAQLSPNRIPFNTLPAQPRSLATGLLSSGAVHALGILVLVVMSSLAILQANATTDLPKPSETPVRLVYLMSPGPGGGGGGGGFFEPPPPPPARKKAAMTFARKAPSPVPPARPRPAPPAREAPPRPEPRIEQRPIDRPIPTPAPAVQAPVRAIAADPLDQMIGVPVQNPPAPPSRGPGAGGGVGAGSGLGLGEGRGGGIGPGSGGGTGGGPYRPGAGIDPPTLVKEVRPSYTDDARRQAIEGDVALEIVVRHDGSVGDVRVRRTLGAGLERKAIEAVRQWRFRPAKRYGTPVDVIVDVSVGFKLR